MWLNVELYVLNIEFQTFDLSLIKSNMSSHNFNN